MTDRRALDTIRRALSWPNVFFAGKCLLLIYLFYVTACASLVGYYFEDYWLDINFVEVRDAGFFYAFLLFAYPLNPFVLWPKSVLVVLGLCFAHRRLLAARHPLGKWFRVFLTTLPAAAVFLILCAYTIVMYEWVPSFTYPYDFSGMTAESVIAEMPLPASLFVRMFIEGLRLELGLIPFALIYPWFCGAVLTFLAKRSGLRVFWWPKGEWESVSESEPHAWWDALYRLSVFLLKVAALSVLYYGVASACESGWRELSHQEQWLDIPMEELSSRGFCLASMALSYLPFANTWLNSLLFVSLFCVLHQRLLASNNRAAKYLRIAIGALPATAIFFILCMILLTLYAWSPSHPHPRFLNSATMDSIPVACFFPARVFIAAYIRGLQSFPSVAFTVVYCWLWGAFVTGLIKLSARASKRIAENMHVTEG